MRVASFVGRFLIVKAKEEVLFFRSLGEDDTLVVLQHYSSSCRAGSVDTAKRNRRESARAKHTSH